MAGRKPGSLARFKCRHCGTVELVSGGSNHFRCAQCRANGFGQSNLKVSWLGRPRAMAIVHAAIRDGRIPSPRTLKCADCRGGAVEYEHRDYNQPLAVDPICRSCNLKRGPARPLAGTVEAMLRRGVVPYRNRAAIAKLCVVMGRPNVAADLPPRLTLSDWHRIWPELVTAEHPAPAEAETAAGQGA